ncbi:MAG: hypothetical protein AAGA69_03925 [Pseudomonadota bacterium]
MSFLSRFRKKKAPASPAEQPALDATGLSKDELGRLTPAQKEALLARIEKDRQRNEHLRNDQRETSSLIARLEFTESGLGMDGLVTDASLGGISFRPASRFIQERSNERVQIIIGDTPLIGILRRTHPNGYGIQVTPRMTDKQLADVLSGPTLDITQLDEIAA